VDSTLTKSATADAETRLPRKFLKADEASLSERDTPLERPILSNTQSVTTRTLQGDTQQFPIPSHSHAANGRPGQGQRCDIRSGYYEPSSSRNLADHQVPHEKERSVPVTALGSRDEINPSMSKRRSKRNKGSRSPLGKLTRKSWSSDESRPKESYTPSPKPHEGVATPVVNTRPRPTFTTCKIKIMIAKDVVAQQTKQALHTIPTK
jgi:hypothetical protein